jgi:hypothetical protein
LFTEPHHQAYQIRPDFYTPAGRDALYHSWHSAMIEQRRIDLQQVYRPEQRRAFFEYWLRDLLKQGYLDAQRPLPTYAYLSEAFDLQNDQVARVIKRLRSERLLPMKKERMHAGVSIWTPRDLYVLSWIADQRAVCYDQVRRLLARESEYETDNPDLLSMTRTTQIIKRWGDAGYAIYTPILARQPGWVYLTRKGLQFVEEDYRAGVPAPGVLTHLYWINEVRFHLEKQYGTNHIDWMPERWLQHQAEQMREKHAKRNHIADGIVALPMSSAEQKHCSYEIEVELSRKSTEYLQRLMRGSRVHGFSSERLRYYVGPAARTTVLSALHHIRPMDMGRSSIEVYELPGFSLLERLEQA